MTDGPEATVGEVVSVDLPRPRTRAVALEHPAYYALRTRIIDFLEMHARQSRRSTLDRVLERYGSRF